MKKHEIFSRLGYCPTCEVSTAFEIIRHHEREYHGNSVDTIDALVAMHWGYDNAGFITGTAKIQTTIIMIDNIELDIRAKYIDVFPSVKCATCSESTNVQ